MIRALTLVVLVMLSGCSLLSRGQPDVTVVADRTPVVCTNMEQKPDAVVLADTPPSVVLGPSEVWGYWFSPDLYASIAENIQAMRRNMKQQRKIRKYLKACITDHNATLEDPVPP